MRKTINPSLFQKNLLDWYSSQKRDLPWRRTQDPYKILISEIMLQQTQVETVIPYYKRWMKRYGSVKKLAEASLDEVLTLWEGMGYYTRARNLHLTAREIVKSHKSRLPGSFESLLRLPGIGRYTAGAIASIAFKQPVPAIDANVRRVFSRICCFSLSASALDKKLEKLIPELMGKASPSDFNQALMELGALICASQNPKCEACPVASQCLACSRGHQTRYPKNTTPKKIEEVKAVLGIITHQGKIYIQKRPPRGLFAGLWEFPGGKIKSNETPEKALRRELLEEIGVKVKIVKNQAVVRHAYTRFRVTLYPYLCRLRDGDRPNSENQKFKWVSLHELEAIALPAANRKIIKMLLKDKKGMNAK